MQREVSACRSQVRYFPGGCSSRFCVENLAHKEEGRRRFVFPLDIFFSLSLSPGQMKEPRRGRRKAVGGGGQRFHDSSSASSNVHTAVLFLPMKRARTFSMFSFISPNLSAGGEDIRCFCSVRQANKVDGQGDRIGKSPQRAGDYASQERREISSRSAKCVD